MGLVSGTGTELIHPLGSFERDFDRGVSSWVGRVARKIHILRAQNTIIMTAVEEVPRFFIFHTSPQLCHAGVMRQKEQVLTKAPSVMIAELDTVRKTLVITYLLPDTFFFFSAAARAHCRLLLFPP